MRALVGAMVLAMTSGAAHAQGLGLMATPAECAALESLVVYGLIDGGIDGDTTVLTGIVQSGDGAICLEELGRYGFGAGFGDEDCVVAWDVLMRNGLPEWVADQIPTFIATILQPASAQDCDDMLFELTAGQ